MRRRLVLLAALAVAGSSFAGPAAATRIEPYVDPDVKNRRVVAGVRWDGQNLVVVGVDGNEPDVCFAIATSWPVCVNNQDTP